jgi:hypothetical protein
VRWLALSVVCAVVAGIAATAATARTAATTQRRILRETTGPTAPIQSALYDPIFLGKQRTLAFQMASQAGATYARIDVSWKSIAPVKLPAHGFDPTNPSSPYYRWGGLDKTVEAAAAAGVQPILDIVGTPTWAYNVQPGTWTGGDPNLTQLGSFAKALALRYDGSHSEPAVHAFSVWNEPNFNRNLYPQNPRYYLSMVNAVAQPVHAASPDNLMLAGELAPFKHSPSKTDKNSVIPPLQFMHTMLCISTSKPYKRTCTPKANIDVWTHHPYSDTGPYGKATGAGGVELGDLPAMNSLLKTAWKLGAINTQSKRAPQFWATEIGWSSNPPNKHGVPMTLLTRWLAESFYQSWRSGVTVATWFLLQDEPKATPFQSGLYFRSNLAKARAKPLLAAFTLPFVAYLKGGGQVLLWGRTTTGTSQNVAIQMKQGKGAWKKVAVITANSNGIFTATLPLHAKSTYSVRAYAQHVYSPGFALKVPSNENLHVTPFPAN